ncbi:MAG: carboxy-S-adenosyl-L-methionine synthase CmoA [Granulosicoccus sp.]
MDNKRDSLYSTTCPNQADFSFDESVAAVFPDMLARSIPGYAGIIAQTGLLAARFAQTGTTLYDLGCSLGATSLAMQTALAEKQRNLNSVLEESYRILAVDSSAAMIARCQSILDQRAFKSSIPIQLLETDLEQLPIRNASVVAMNFTLQFVKPDKRDALMQRIADGLQPGGVLILSEKICFCNDDVDRLFIEMYHAYKKANGYSDLEISQKRTALENVLVPDTLEQHERRLQQSGFSSCHVWFQCFNFISLIAFKRPSSESIESLDKSVRDSAR